MEVAIPPKPEVQVRKLMAGDLAVSFVGVPYYFVELVEGAAGRFYSYYSLPHEYALLTQMQVLRTAEVRGELCLEVERVTYAADGSVYRSSTYFLAVRPQEVAWRLRVRRNPNEPVQIEEPTAVFPRQLRAGLKWAHRRVTGLVDLSVNGRSFHCLEVESSASKDPHLTRLYVGVDGRQVYNRRWLRTDAPTSYDIASGAPVLMHRGWQFVPYYEDFAEFALG
jgi:hypothetical protein